MEKFNLYSKKARAFFRVVSIIAVCILICSTTYRIASIGLSQLLSTWDGVSLVAQNVLSALLLLFVAISPNKFGLISIVTFLYALVIIVFDINNPMGMLMYFLGVFTLMARGFLNKNKKKKLIIFALIYIVLNFTKIRFGMDVFASEIINVLGYSFVMTMSYFFLQFFFRCENEDEEKNHILDLSIYPELKKRDADWLFCVQKKIKYETIAIESQMNIGSVKNRMKVVFDVLQVGDKTGFLNKYSDYEIYFGDEKISKD